MFTILVVEDDAPLQRMMSAFLGLNGFSVVGAANGEEALNAIDKVMPDLVIADVMMPVMDGWELTRELRRCYPRLPIMLVTARDTIEDKRTGFTSGADDYLTKPFSVEELLARIRTTLRRLSYAQTGGVASEGSFDTGELHIDFDAGIATMDGEELHLTPIEYKLLCLFLRSPGQVLTKETILNALWDCEGNYVDTNTLTVYIRRLRLKVEDDPGSPQRLVTVRGMGYRWNGDV